MDNRKLRPEEPSTAIRKLHKRLPDVQALGRLGAPSRQPTSPGAPTSCSSTTTNASATAPHACTCRSAGRGTPSRPARPAPWTRSTPSCAVSRRRDTRAQLKLSLAHPAAQTLSTANGVSSRECAGMAGCALVCQRPLALAPLPAYEGRFTDDHYGFSPDDEVLRRVTSALIGENKEGD